jgi:NAD(P)-dependent dehydrogenase (short-subunit alcohol dehydrogenase family)
MMDLTGRVAVVTGGGSGIGAACVQALKAEGAAPVSWDLKGADIVCDVTSTASIDAAIAQTVSRHGSPSLLVACAGIAGRSTILDMDVEAWDRIFAVNMRGVMLSVQAVGRAMLAAKSGGAMVIISSVNGTIADPGISAYSAAKAGCNHFARVAAREFGPHGIRVNSIGPGPTVSPMLAQSMARPGYVEDVVQQSALGAMGTAEQVADAVVNLMKMDWVTGQTLLVDGGSSLNTGRKTAASAPTV